MPFLTLIFAAWIQISFAFNIGVSSISNFEQNTILVNKNDKFYSFSLSFMDYKSAMYYSNKIFLDNIRLNKGECKVNIKNVICFVDENIFNDKLSSNYVSIRLENEKKIIKVQKLYYTLETLKNKLIFNLLSNDIYSIKVLEKKIEPIDHLSKFEIDISNINKVIEIDLYDGINSKKIGKIKEKLEYNYLRLLEDDTNKCFLNGDEIYIDLTGKIVENEIKIYIQKTGENQSPISISDYNLNEGILNVTIPKDFESGQYVLNIYSNDDNIYSQNIEIKNRLFLKEEDIFITVYNTSEPLSVIVLTQYNSQQLELLNSKDNNTTKLTIASYLSYNKRIIIENITVSDPLLSYKIISQNLCDQNNYYVLADLYILPQIKLISNGLVYNTSTTTTLTLIGTYIENAINYIIIRPYSWGNIDLEEESKSFYVYQSNIVYIDKNDDNYTINVTFDLTNSNMSNQDYEIEIYFMENRAMQPKINISVLKCDDETFPNENINKCVTCQELNKYYSKERKSCLSSCESNEYSYEHTCYDKCPDRTYLYNIKHICLDNCDNHEYDTKLGGNNECINKTFELEKIEPEVLDISDNLTIYLKFKENIFENRLINISISNYTSIKCTYLNVGNNYSCSINLSSFNNTENEYSIDYTIKKGDDSILLLNSKDIKVKIKLSSEICNNFYYYYNKETKKCEECIDNKYYYDKTCKDCNELKYYVLEKQSTLICNETCSNIKEYHKDINQTYCVEKCSKGYGFKDLNDKTECIKCKDDSMIQDENQMCICDSSKYIYDSENEKCILCSSISEGMIPNNGKCICDPKKYELNSEGKCTLCSSIPGMIAKDGKCICDSTIAEYNRTGKNECTICSSIPGMIIKDGKCICDPTKYVLNSEGKCTLCSSIPGMIINDGKCICDSTIAEYNRTGKNECTICSSISEGMYSLNGKCVCNSSLYEYNYNNDGKCTLCTSINSNMISNNGKCECKSGTIQMIVNNNIICEHVKNCKDDNICMNGTCDDSSGNIICNCYNGYFGKQCSESINDNNYEEIINNIQNEIESLVGNVNSLDENKTKDLFSNQYLTNQIQQVSLLYKTKNSTTEVEKETIYETIKNLTIKVINLYKNIDSTEQIQNFTSFIEYIGFTLYYHKYSSNKRRLSENNIISDKDIIVLSKKINVTNLPRNKLISSINNAFSYILFDYSSSNYDKYVQLMKNNHLTYIYKDDNLKTVDSILHTIVSSSVTSESQSNQILTTLYYKNTMKEITNVNYIINYDSFKEVNEVLYSYYWENGMNIYNQNDDVFNNKCYRNKKLKYDLTTKYKKYSLYQGAIIVDSCQVNNQLINEQKVYYICNSDTSFYYSFIKDPSMLPLKDKYSLLPLKCLNKINEIYNNLGFWIFFFLMIFLIIITLFYSKSEKEFLGDHINYDILDNDKLYTERIKTEEKKDIYKNIYFKESFLDNLYSKLLTFHPITTLYRPSLLIQFQFKYWLFIFNISMLFGFNALLCTEKYIERRIYDKHRNDFGYPMRKEFGKIISSILLTMILTFLIKLSNITSLNEKKLLAIKLKKNEEENKDIALTFMKEKLILRLIIFTIMFILIIFMWIYSIGFCYIYYNSQINWLYSFIWSIFWLWIIIAPLIITISCVIEHYITSYYTNEMINHYSNLLFCF